MPLTIHCTHCGVPLNLPEKAEGRRLKCPKCGEKFLVGPAGASPAAPAGGMAGGARKDSGATLLLAGDASSMDLPSMPTTGGGDLRESFDLPMMTGSAPPTPAKATSAPAGGEPADALALFQDSGPPRRKKTGAEARASSRRCPTCGGVVPAGMSLCQSCGLDLESGTRVDLTDDLSPPPPPPAPGLTIAMSVVGGLCLAASAALTLAALVFWYKGVAGAIFFAPIALFGIFASVQFLRGKTAKLLLVALTLGAVLDLSFMIAYPIYTANQEAAAIEHKISSSDDPEIENEMIKPLAERLDSATISRGIALLVLYAGVSIYLISPTVSRHMRRG